MFLQAPEVVVRGDLLRIEMAVGQGPAEFPVASLVLATPAGRLVSPMDGGSVPLTDGAGTVVAEYSVDEPGTYQLWLGPQRSWVIEHDGSRARCDAFADYHAPEGTEAHALERALERREHERTRERAGHPMATAAVPSPPSVALPRDSDEALRVVEAALSGTPDVASASIDVASLANGSFAVVVSGLPDPVGSWRDLRALRSEHALWPLLIGGIDDIDFEPDDDDRFDGQSVMEVLIERLDAIGPVPMGPADGWPDVVAQHRLGYDVHGPQNGPGALVIVPARHGWEVIEAIRWSDGNTFPSWLHRDVVRRWEQAHGAELAVIDGATVELFVPAPAFDPERVADLAREVRAYGDAVGVGHDTWDSLDEIAAGLLTSTVWSFWWD